MKSLLVVLALLGFTAPARAGLYYSNDANASSDTLRVAGIIRVNDPAAPYTSKITINGVNGTVTATTFAGNATTASALAANGSNCGAGNYPLGVDASGNSEGCTTAGAGDFVNSANNTVTGNTTFRGTGVAISAVSGEGTSGQAYLDLSAAGYGAGSIEWIGNVGSILGYNAPVRHRFYVNNGNPNPLDITATGIEVFTATFTATSAGVVTAPSQSGAQFYLPGNITLPSGQNNIFWDTTVSNAASYNRQNTVVAGSSNTFTAHGTGLYFVSFCARITTLGSYAYLGFRASGSTTWFLTNAGAVVTDETHCVTGFLSAVDGATYEAYIQSDNTVTVAGGLSQTRMAFQKIW